MGQNAQLERTYSQKSDLAGLYVVRRMGTQQHSFRAWESVFSKKNQFNMRMRQERAMGVLLRLNGRFAPMVGQNALLLKNTNSVILLKIRSYFQI